MLLHATQQALLQRNSAGELILNGDQLSIPVAALVQYLANHPTDGRIRIGLEDLLSVETAGSTGLAVAVSLVLNAASVRISQKKHSCPQLNLERGTSEVDLRSFLQNVYEWMALEEPLILAVAKLPASLLPASPDSTFADLRLLITVEQDLRDSSAARAFELVLHTGILLAPHTSTPHGDLELIRYAAARLISANRLQSGRDLAETALAIAGDDAGRRRLAWLAFGDIYHRVHNSIASWIGLACMFAVDADIDVEQM
ncbi:MAG: hypothetical protein ABSH49_35330 [Bryobacteraceae bacterium]|jgi:hypothetical protein